MTMTACYTTDYHKLALLHYALTAICVTCFGLGLHFSEGYESDFPYFCTGMVLGSFNFIQGTMALIVYIFMNVGTVTYKKKERSSCMDHIYQLVILIGYFWVFVGSILTGSYGICKRDKPDACYYHDNVRLHRSNAIVLILLHLLYLVLISWVGPKTKNIQNDIFDKTVKAKSINTKHTKIESSKTGVRGKQNSSKKPNAKEIELPSLRIQSNFVKDKPARNNTPQHPGSKRPGMLKKQTSMFELSTKTPSLPTHDQQPTHLTRNRLGLRLMVISAFTRVLKRKNDQHRDNRVNASRASVNSNSESGMGSEKNSIKYPNSTFQQQKHFQTNADRRGRIDDPYWLPPVPTNVSMTSHPEHIYTSTSFPDTEVVVIHPETHH